MGLWRYRCQFLQKLHEPHDTNQIQGSVVAQFFFRCRVSLVTVFHPSSCLKTIPFRSIVSDQAGHNTWGLISETKLMIFCIIRFLKPAIWSARSRFRGDQSERETITWPAATAVTACSFSFHSFKTPLPHFFESRLNQSKWNFKLPSSACWKKNENATNSPELWKRLKLTKSSLSLLNLPLNSLHA